MTGGGTSDNGFEEFRKDIDAAEKKIAGEIEPGARALVVAILVFVLIVSFVLPHTGGVKGFDALVGGPAAADAAVALPSRVFLWLALVFSVGSVIVVCSENTGRDMGAAPISCGSTDTSANPFTGNLAVATIGMRPKTLTRTSGSTSLTARRRSHSF